VKSEYIEYPLFTWGVHVPTPKSKIMGAVLYIGVNLKKVGLEDLDGGKEKRKVQLS